MQRLVALDVTAIVPFRKSAQYRRFLRCIPSQVCFEPLTRTKMGRALYVSRISLAAVVNCRTLRACGFLSVHTGSPPRAHPLARGHGAVATRECHVYLCYVTKVVLVPSSAAAAARDGTGGARRTPSRESQLRVRLGKSSESDSTSSTGSRKKLLVLLVRGSKHTSIYCQSLLEQCLTALFWQETRYVWWRILVLVQVRGSKHSWLGIQRRERRALVRMESG
jgi:hypothetical protein